MDLSTIGEKIFQRKIGRKLIYYYTWKGFFFCFGFLGSEKFMNEFSGVSVILALESLRFVGKTEESLRCLRTLRLYFVIIIFIASIIISTFL